MQHNVPIPNLGQPKQQYEIKDTQSMDCPCGNRLFLDGVILRTLSKILTGEDKDRLISVPVVYCSKCGEILQKILPAELKDVKIV